MRALVKSSWLAAVVAGLVVAGSCTPPDPGPPAPPWSVSTYAGRCGASAGNVDGPKANASFYLPVGIDVDVSGRVVVAEGDSQTVRIISNGNVGTLAGSPLSPGTADGPGATARFTFPFDVATAPSGIVYVSDTGSHTIRAISPDGNVSTLAGSPGARGAIDGTGSAARFNEPAGLAIGPEGQLYVADRGNGTLRVVTPDGEVSTLAGSSGHFGYSDGIGAAARFSRFNGVDVDSDGNVWIADTNNVTIRRVTPAGVVSTIAGVPGESAPVDGTGTNARFSFPYQLTVDSGDNVYVADGDSTIRRVTPSGQVTTPIGGANAAGCLDGIGTAARLWAPQGIATDINDRLLVADTGNHVIRRITTR